MFLLLSASNSLLCVLFAADSQPQNISDPSENWYSRFGSRKIVKWWKQPRKELFTKPCGRLTNSTVKFQVTTYFQKCSWQIDKNNKIFFSICGCFWWRDLVSVLLCICGLYYCLCISFVKVKIMYLILKIYISLWRYIDIRSMDPLDRDHKGLKIKKKQYTKSSSPEEQKCFFKEE